MYSSYYPNFLKYKKLLYWYLLEVLFRQCNGVSIRWVSHEAAWSCKLSVFIFKLICVQHNLQKKNFFQKHFQFYKQALFKACLFYSLNIWESYLSISLLKMRVTPMCTLGLMGEIEKSGNMDWAAENLYRETKIFWH